MDRVSGTYVTTTTSGEAVRAFVPNPLPPDPPLSLESNDRDLLASALAELGRLDLAARLVPDPDIFLYAFVRKEAVLSSQIEGVQATLVDLFAFEGEPDGAIANPDVKEVCNYLDALTWARKELASSKGLPLSLRLLRAAHKRLMKGVRGRDKQPGEFRSSQVWIGGTRPGNAAFVPPPPDKLMVSLDAFEKYLHAKDALHPLVRAGLMHAQFETIHPFLDGNGRLGRLLVSLLLEEWDLLQQPLLYISLHFKRHRSEYYERLNAVRTDGDWEGWTRFFLRATASVATEATEATSRIWSLLESDRRTLVDHPRTSLHSVRLLDKLPQHPVMTIREAIRLLHTTKPTATKAVSQLVDRGILRETSGRRRDRIFAYRKYLDILKAGTEL